MVFDRIEFTSVNWTDLQFAEWLAKQDMKWTTKHIHSTNQYIANKEIVATVRFKRLNKEPFMVKTLNIRKDLL